MKSSDRKLVYVVLVVMQAYGILSGDVCYQGNPNNDDLKSSGDSGVIKSPYYPSNYRGNMECTWIIEVPIGYHIILEFTTFQLQASFFTKCLDYVEIIDGPNGYTKRLGKYCGTNSYLRFETKENSAKIIFRSDWAFEYKGFSMKYRAVENDSGISGGAIAGIIVGVLLGLIITIVLIVVCCKNSGSKGTVVEHPAQSQQRTTTTTTTTLPGATTVAYSNNQQAVQFVQAPVVYSTRPATTQIITVPQQTTYVTPQQNPTYIPPQVPAYAPPQQPPAQPPPEYKPEPPPPPPNY